MKEEMKEVILCAILSILAGEIHRKSVHRTMQGVLRSLIGNEKLTENDLKEIVKEWLEFVNDKHLRMMFDYVTGSTVDEIAYVNALTKQRIHAIIKMWTVRLKILIENRINSEAV